MEFIASVARNASEGMTFVDLAREKLKPSTNEKHLYEISQQHGELSSSFVPEKSAGRLYPPFPAARQKLKG
jgi:hypothetical protein